MSLIRKVASVLAKAEGKKSQVKMGDVREIVGLISDLMYMDIFNGTVYAAFIRNGQKRLDSGKSFLVPKKKKR